MNGPRKSREKMHIGMFFKNTGHHIASWRHPEAQPDAGINIRHYADCAVTAEKAGFDFIFFADSVCVREGPIETLSRSAQYIAYFEPLTLLSALAMVTSRIGLVATSTTSYNEPYHVARRYASLDHISGGRAGWNVVTSGMEAEAYNFGRDEHYEHDARYRRAAEFVQVVQGLWDSWDDDAFLYDREEGRFWDPRKLHTLNHHGEHFKVRGPLNVPRPIQGQPVIFQAGTSQVGRELAAATAEGVFSGELTVERSAAHYADVKGRMLKYGRRPEQMKILPGVTIMVGKTEAEAKEKEEYLAFLIHPMVGREYVAMFLGMDLSDCDVDDPVPDRPTSRPKSGMNASLRALVEREHLTIRQLYERIAGSHGKLTLRGTPSQIADEMERWYENIACDGFIVQPSYMPGDLNDICELLVPELQNRGLIRVGYDGCRTLRDNMGLERPVSRYSEGGIDPILADIKISDVAAG